ncbi:MAG TPA: flagellar motor protein [Solirubrobacteraceae bacterium]|nr:flagellar motor protein [Solirubrobacteraceae bacterium]
MKAATAVGIAIAVICMIMAIFIEGGSPLSMINIPAALIVLGGTLGVTLGSTSMEQMKAIPALYKKSMSTEPIDYRAEIDRIVAFAEKARREGLLALDAEVGQIEDDFLRKGMQLVVDGTDPELVREILEADLEGMEHRHREAVQPFVQAGGFGPTLGVLGTVASLVHVLENLDKPETLGHSIAGAFIATLYGVGSANVFYYPVANRLKLLSGHEVLLKNMVIEGVLAIQAGENPRIIADRLMTFVPPAERGEDKSSGDGPALAEAA